MLNNEIAYINGKSSRDFGVFLIDGNIFDFPKRDVEFLNVPGRSGSLTIDKGRWDNIDITYTFATYGKDAPTKLNAWKDFLLTNTGYLKIETSVEPNIYREGVYKGASSPRVSMLGGGGYMDVTFSCMPQKWLKANCEDDDRIDITNNLMLRNPTNYDARPLLNVSAGNGGGYVQFDNYVHDNIANTDYRIARSKLTITVTNNMWIDCETGDAFKGTTVYTPYVQLTEGSGFPVISGQSKVMQNSSDLRSYITDSYTYTLINISNISTVYMFPRWWTI
jgi:phage-related protein